MPVQSVRTRAAWALAAVVLATAVTLVTRALSQPAAVTPDRRVAAEFIGVAPDAVTMVGEKPQMTLNPWGARRLTGWTYSSRSASFPERVRALLFVDVDLYYVARWHWEDDQTHWGPAASADTALRSREEALAAAGAFLAKRCPFWQPGDRLTYEKYQSELPQPLYVFAWEGQGPEEFTHWVEVSISAVTGEAVAYSASVDPPSAPAAKPLRLSADEAVQRVRQMLPTLQPGTVEVTKLVVMGLRTGGTPCSLPGQPVYLVDVEAYKTPEGYNTEPREDSKPLDRAKLIFYRIVYEVDATTGEMLTKPVALQEAPAPTAPQISAEQALQIAKRRAPEGLTQPTFVVSALTNRCRVAPPGTWVYPLRISGRVPDPDDPATLVPWAQTWAVDAETGIIYGLGDRSPEPAAPARG